MIGAVILCAGASDRMGFPKHLLDVGGRSALRAAVSASLAATDGPVAVVVRPGHEDAAASAGCPSDPRVLAAVNPRPERGRTGSIQRGLRALIEAGSSAPDPLTGCLIWPVDMPLVAHATVQRIADQLRADGVRARVIPEHAGRGGHPVAVGREHWPFLAGMDPDEPLRRLFREPGFPVARLAVDDPAVHYDLNTPEEALRFLGSPARPWTGR
jgi:molybdenum cofactor cytidylyltransferase